MNKYIKRSAITTVRHFGRIMIFMFLVFVFLIPNFETEAALKTKINKKKVSIYVNQTVKLKLSGAVGNTTWISSNKKVATVSKKGTVIGKKAGKVTITAKNNGKEYKCKVTVKSQFSRDDEIVLYNKTIRNKSDDIIGNQKFDDFGLVVDDRLVLDKYYSLADRTVEYVCKFDPNCIALFESVIESGDTYITSTVLEIDVANKTIRVGALNNKRCKILNGTDTFKVSITKHYLDYIVNIHNIDKNQSFEVKYVNNGTGGAGEGAIGQEMKTGMQWDYYALNISSTNSFSVSNISVKCANCDILVYGDSITEPEAYYPKDQFTSSWTQLLRNSNKNAVMTSGRSGTSIQEIMKRIGNELPYIKPKYCMITIGTNGGVSVENLSALVEYIQSNNVIPILNHIPCYDNNGDTTGFIAVNEIIDTVRTKYSLNGCDFDLATFKQGSALSVDTSKMWYETYWDGSHYYHHPNSIGSESMFKRILLDVPELFE